MIPFDEGYDRIARLGKPIGTERISLEDARGRVLCEDLIAARAHPAHDISAMDGYAVSGAHERYHLMGEVAAGQIYDGAIKDGEALRIFTGALVPEGVDRVLIQENAQIKGEQVYADPIPEKGENIRLGGGDFEAGFTIPSPRRLNAADLALIGAMNIAEFEVSKTPSVAILATGSELVLPAQAQAPNQVIASNAYGLKALAEQYGARAEILPIVNDDPDEIANAMREAQCDLLVTTGGASVGKYDFVESSAKAAGFEIALHKIALRPGKPIMAGKRGSQIFLGLPGNPVSSMVCAVIFMRAVIRGQLGLENAFPKLQKARLAGSMPANGDRVHFMRALITQSETGFEADILSNQDSAAISLLSKTNGLVVVKPNEPARTNSDLVDFLFLRS